VVWGQKDKTSDKTDKILDKLGTNETKLDKLEGGITVPFVLVLFAFFVKDSGLWTKGTTLQTKGTKILDKSGTKETKIRQA
jgi:hypothetical protein